MRVSTEVARAMEGDRPVVALESTVIAHGLPWPMNLEVARELEATVRNEGAVPATIAVLSGEIRVGLDEQALEVLARGGVLKANRRDLAGVIIDKQNAATTVSATMFLAQRAGIRILATGGIGGVHRDAARTFDISADLLELARTPVCVVCSGAKAILDLPATLEVLETLGVPVVGYGTQTFPAFFVREGGPRLERHAGDPLQVAELLRCHWNLSGAGVVVAQPCPPEHALDPTEFEAALRTTHAEAEAKAITGKALTPFLLGRLGELTGGKSLRANQALLSANAALAARIARHFRRP